MTDARLPGPWLFRPEFMALSPNAWWLFTRSLMYGAENGTDGLLPAPVLLLIAAPSAFDREHADELVDARLWREVSGGGFMVLNWEQSQSTAAEIEQKRDDNRQRQRAWRAAKRESQIVMDDVKPPVTRDERRGVTGDVGQERTGQDRTVLKRSGLEVVESLRPKLTDVSERSTRVKSRSRSLPTGMVSQKQLDWIRDMYVMTNHEMPDDSEADRWATYTAEQANEVIKHTWPAVERLKFRDELEPADAAILSETGREWLAKALEQPSNRADGGEV